jgi:hypothetical protein
VLLLAKYTSLCILSTCSVQLVSRECVPLHCELVIPGPIGGRIIYNPEIVHV